MSDFVAPSKALSAVPSSAIRELLTLTERPDVLGLAGGLPSVDLIPAATIAEATAAVLADSNSLQYGVSRGGRRCREAIAEFDDLVCAEQVIVTHGSQQGLFLIAHALLDPGDLVFVDDPVYVGAAQAFATVRARIEAIPLSATGIDTDELERRLLAGARPRMVHTVSSFHNPGGVSADEIRRRHLAELADRFGFWVIDDDPYARLRFSGAQTAPVRTHGERVLSLGSVSKILAPALRVGWVSGPQHVIEMLERYRQSVDLCGSTFAHAVVADLLGRRAWLSSHTDTVVNAYRARARALTDALTRHLGGAATFVEPEGGMFCWVRMPGQDAAAMLPRAIDAGVAYVPGSAFAVTADFTDHLRLGFATLGPSDLDEAVRRLASVVATRE